jgi:RNA polymerase sigma factor (sigma-70 family)
MDVEHGDMSSRRWFTEMEAPHPGAVMNGGNMDDERSTQTQYGGRGRSSNRDGGNSGEVDVVRLYLDDIGERLLLDRDDEIRLSMRVESGMRAQALLDAGRVPGEKERCRLARQVEDGFRARQEFVEANLRLVVSIVKRFRRPGVELLDLVQAGNIGLMRAVEGFDWRLGNKFSTYATWWIRQAAIRESGLSGRVIRIPLNLLDQISALSHSRDRLRVELGHEPTTEEIAEDAGEPRQRVAQLLAIARDAVSLSLPVGDSEDSELADLVADKRDADPGESAALHIEREEVRSLLGHLSDHEAAVLRLRYGLDDGEARSLEEVGQRLGVSRERASQLETRALSHLRFDDDARALRPAS